MDIQLLLKLVRSQYPGWNGFDHPGFVKDEIDYKQQAIRMATETLSRQELERLLEEGKAGEVIPRVRDLAAATNLLYLSSVTGDLALLYKEPDPVSFIGALIDLLHGPDDSPQRLDRFVAWARQLDLPVRWPLPTYLLFFTHPDRDYFVKPGVTRWFLETVGAQGVYRPEPSRDIYSRILDAVHELKDALAEFQPRDVVDVQSFIWVAFYAATSGPRYWKIAPDSGARMWDECREGGFIAIGWEELGDVGQMSRKEFEEQRDKLLVQHNGEKGWTRNGLDQVWDFSHEIREGDKIVANQGTSLVLGIGTVSGSYEFVPDAYYGHRLPVDWEDTRPRQVQEGNWRRTLLELNRERFERIQASDPVGVVEGKGFSRRTFELLEGLQQNSTKAFYLEHKDDFQNYVEVPFQETFRAAISGLPAPITELMETQESLFGRIPKNDYGRGGAWPYYWGALYPKGGQRIRDAQLSLWINHVRLRAGFYIGEYGSEQRALFVRNCVKHRDAIVHRLGERFSDSRLLFGSRDYYENPDAVPVTWQEWLADPGLYGVSVGVPYSASEVLASTFEGLSADIAKTWELLFPLVLLAVHEEPMEPLLRYLGEGPDPSILPLSPEYPLEECARDTRLDVELLRRWVAAIHRKKQAILYGPPGTGKTHLADHLARHLVGGGRGFFELVQFHPSYSYEEFIQGIRPEARPDGGLAYPLKKGRFLEFCERASELGKEDFCVLIIDEINRANLSRVFGELMYLLEYREAEVPLASGRKLRIPENVRILGTMNTADRSIALVDHALRRRFAFLNLKPDFDILRRFHANNGYPVEQLVALLQRLNADIRDPHYEVGITFFLRSNLASEIEDIWRMEIVPYLEEYFFDQPERVEAYRWERVQKDLQG